MTSIPTKSLAFRFAVGSASGCSTPFLKALALSCALAAVGACESNSTVIQGNESRSTASKQAITVEGCLQTAGRGTLILSRPTEELEKTTGTLATPEGDTGRHERVRSAAMAYRIEPPATVNTDGMIGKRVRVTGAIRDRAALDQGSAQPATTAGDLIEIKAVALSVLGEMCEGQGSHTP